MDKYKTIEDYLAGLDEHKLSQVQTLRKYIIQTDPSLTEHIKWNAPSYVKDGEDRITFNTMNKESLVKLVFHMGATRKENKKGKPVLDDPFSIMEWASDIRGYITFKDYDDVTRKETAVKQLTLKWLEIA